MQQGPNIYQIKFEPDLPEDVLIAADVDGMEQRICGEDIYPYWEYIYENEGGFVETDGRYILCVLIAIFPVLVHLVHNAIKFLDQATIIFFIQNVQLK